jgi:hypothetical protein
LVQAVTRADVLLQHAVQKGEKLDIFEKLLGQCVRSHQTCGALLCELTGPRMAR